MKLARSGHTANLHYEGQGHNIVYMRFPLKIPTEDELRVKQYGKF